MGGYVNLVIRKDGATRKTLSYTGIIKHMFNAKFFEGDETVIRKLFHMYGSCPEITDPARGLMAPFNYGLIVVDYDIKHVFDMQSHACIFLAGTGWISEQFQYIPDLLKRGWLGDGMVNTWGGEDLPELVFPPGLSKESSEEIASWLLTTSTDYVKKHYEGLIEPGRTPVPGVRMHPPGWEFRSYDRAEGRAMKEDLLEAGYSLTPDEQGIWQAWEKENLAQDEPGAPTHEPLA